MKKGAFTSSVTILNAKGKLQTILCETPQKRVRKFKVQTKLYGQFHYYRATVINFFKRLGLELVKEEGYSFDGSNYFENLSFQAK